MSKCFRCEISTATVQCDDCGSKDPEPVIYCDECSDLMHIGKMARHQVVPMMYMKMKDEKLKDFAKYNQKYKGVEQRLEELGLLERNVEELLRVHERNIRLRVVELQDKLKKQAGVLMNELKAATKLKIDKITEAREKLLTELEAMKECSEKINSVLSLDDGDFSKDVQNDSSIMNQPWVEADLSSLDVPRIYLDYSVDFAAVDKEIECLKVNLEDEKPIEFVMEAPKWSTGEEPQVSVCSALQKNGTFNVSAPHSSSALLTLHSLSTEIRCQMIRNADWLTYSILDELPAVGDKVFARHPLDKKWYRAQIREQNRNTPSEFLVLFLDHGNMLTVGSTALMPYKDIAPNCQFQAFVCSMFPSLDVHIPIDPIWLFHDVTRKFTKLFCNIKEKLPDTDIWEVELLGQNYPEEEKISISNQIITKVSEQKGKSAFSSRDIRYRDGAEATSPLEGGEEDRGRKKGGKKKKNKRGERERINSERSDGCDHNAPVDLTDHTTSTSDPALAAKDEQSPVKPSDSLTTVNTEGQVLDQLRLECAQTPVKPEGMSLEDLIRLSPSLAAIPFSGQEGMSWADIMEMQQKSPGLLPMISPQSPKELFPPDKEKAQEKIGVSVQGASTQESVTGVTANGESRDPPIVPEENAEVPNAESLRQEICAAQDDAQMKELDLKPDSDLKDEVIAASLRPQELVTSSTNGARGLSDEIREAARAMQSHYECEVMTAAIMGAESEHFVEHQLRDTMENLLSEVIQCATEVAQQRSEVMEVTEQGPEVPDDRGQVCEVIESSHTSQENSKVRETDCPNIEEVIESSHTSQEDSTVRETDCPKIEEVDRSEVIEPTPEMVTCAQQNPDDAELVHETTQGSSIGEVPDVVMRGSCDPEPTVEKISVEINIQNGMPDGEDVKEGETVIDTKPINVTECREGATTIISDESTSDLPGSGSTCDALETDNITGTLPDLPASQSCTNSQEHVETPSMQGDQVSPNQCASTDESATVLPEVATSTDTAEHSVDTCKQPSNIEEQTEEPDVMISEPDEEVVPEEVHSDVAEVAPENAQTEIEVKQEDQPQAPPESVPEEQTERQVEDVRAGELLAAESKDDDVMLADNLVGDIKEAPALSNGARQYPEEPDATSQDIMVISEAKAPDIKAYVPPSPDRGDDENTIWSHATAYVPPPPPPDQSPCSPPAEVSVHRMLMRDEFSKEAPPQDQEPPSDPRIPLMKHAVSPVRPRGSADSDGNEDVKQRRTSRPSEHDDFGSRERKSAKEKPIGKDSPKALNQQDNVPVESKNKAAPEHPKVPTKAKSLMDHLPKQIFYEGARFQGRVTSDISEDGKFWLQLGRVQQQEEEAFKSLENQLQTYSRLATAVNDPVIGQLVLAEYKGYWYRARVQKTTAARAQVSLVDAGKDVSVPRTAIKGLEKFCQLPEQAKLCCMATNEYRVFTDAARKLFSKKTRDKILNVLVLHLMEDLPYVAVFDCSDPKQPPFNIYAHIVTTVPPPPPVVEQALDQSPQMFPVTIAPVPMVSLPMNFSVPPPTVPGDGSMSAGQPPYTPEMAIAQFLSIISPNPGLQQEIVELFEPRGPNESLESFEIRQQKQHSVAMLQSQVMAMAQGGGGGVGAGGGGGMYVPQEAQYPGGGYQQVPPVSQKLDGSQIGEVPFTPTGDQPRGSPQRERPVLTPQHSNLNYAAEEWKPRQSNYRPNDGSYSSDHRSQHQGSYSDRRHGDRSFNDRQHGDRSHGNRPQGDQPYGDRPYNDRQHGDRSHGNRPQGDQSYGDRGPRGDRSYGNRSQGDLSSSDRPQGDRHQRHSGREPWTSAPRRHNSPASRDIPPRYRKNSGHQDPPNRESPNRPTYRTARDSPSRPVEQESWNLEAPPVAPTEFPHQDTTTNAEMEQQSGTAESIETSDPGASTVVPSQGKESGPFDEDAWVEGETVVEQTSCPPSRSEVSYGNSEPQHRRQGRPHDSRHNRNRPTSNKCYICSMEGHIRADCPKRQPTRRDKH